MQEWYLGWWSKPKKMTKKQIQEMIHNMQETEIINKRSKEYHEKEEREADSILDQLEKE